MSDKTDTVSDVVLDIKVVIASRIGPERMTPLLQGPNLIGRWDPDTGAFPEIDLEDDDHDCEVSRKHAVIECTGEGEIAIEDLGSLNGTYINERNLPLKPGVSYPLKEGDKVLIGGLELKLSRGQGAEA